MEGEAALALNDDHLPLSALILAGGSSKRLGRDKASLPYSADESFLEHLAQELSGADQLLVSVKKGSTLPKIPGAELVFDAGDGSSGPLAGLAAGAQAAKSPLVLVVSCDVPLVKKSLAYLLLLCLSPDAEAAVPSAQGKMQPLIALYRRAALLKAASQALLAERKSVFSMLSFLEVKEIPLKNCGLNEDMLLNVNTPEAYSAFKQAAQGPPLVAVSGHKNSGKTTLICSLCRYFSEKGLSVDVIKSSHYNHEFDRDGSDTQKIIAAGAKSALIFSPSAQLCVEQIDSTNSAERALSLARESRADLVLLEGFTSSDIPQIRLFRREAAPPEPLSKNTLAVVSDFEPEELQSLKTENITLFKSGEIEKIAQKIEQITLRRSV